MIYSFEKLSVFQSSCTTAHSQQWWLRFWFPYIIDDAFHTLSFFFFLKKNMAVSLSVKWHCYVVWFALHFPMASNAEPLFTCLKDLTCLYGKMPIQGCCLFPNGVCLLLHCKNLKLLTLDARVFLLFWNNIFHNDWIMIWIPSYDIDTRLVKYMIKKQFYPVY